MRFFGRNDVSNADARESRALASENCLFGNIQLSICCPEAVLDVHAWFNTGNQVDTTQNPV